MNFAWKARFIELIFMIGLFRANFSGDNAEISIISFTYSVLSVISCLILEVSNLKPSPFVKREIVCAASL